MIHQALLCAAAAAATLVLDPVVPAPVPAPLAGDLLGATVHRLPNGLTVYLSPNPQLPRITAWIAVRTGSKHDPADCTGLAHYLEHMLFKGSERLGTLDWGKERPHYERIIALYEERFRAADPAEKARLYREIDRENLEAVKWEIPNELDKLYNQAGFDGLNAFTMDEGTVYVCNFPKNRAELWARTEADRFARPVFRLFSSEIETVYEEKNRSLDNPERGLFEGLARALYKRHPYGTQTTLGSVEHLKNPSLKRVAEFYREHYRPNNMCVVLAGDFDRTAMLALLAKTFGGWEPAPVPAAGPWPLPAPNGTERLEVTFESEEKLVMAWMTVPRNHPDADALTVMDMLMANAATGIIDISLVQQQRVKSAGSWTDMNNDAGAWYAQASPKAGQTLAQAEALLLGCVERLKRGEFTDEDLRAIITNFEVGEKRELEYNDARVNRMAFSFLGFEEWSRAADRLNRLRRVTRADVLRVARQYLGKDRVVALRRNGKPVLPVIPKPEFTKVDIDASRQSSFFRSLLAVPAAPIVPRWVKAGRDYAVSDRPFGRLWTTRNPMNDVFTVSIGFVGGTGEARELGAAFDLLEKAGAGELTAEGYQRRLYALGTSISLSADERWCWIGLSGLEANLEEALRLLMRRFVDPKVEPGTLEKMVEVAIGAHADNRKNPQSIFSALNGFAQRGAESPVLRELSDADVRGLKQDRLLALARSVWDTPADVRYVGTRTPEEFARIWQAAMKAPVAPRRPRRTIAVVKAPATRVLFTHRDMVQSRVAVWAPDGTYDPAQAVDQEFYTSYMGGSMSSVIFQEIREARSLAYAAGGGYDDGHWKGDDNRITGGLGCQADKTIEATALLVELMRKPPLDARRFAETRQAVLEGYRTNPLHFRDIPDAVLRWEEQGVTGGDPRSARYARAQRYTLAELGRFANRFGTAPMSIVIMGHRDRVGLEAIKRLGAFEDVTLDRIFPY